MKKNITNRFFFYKKREKYVVSFFPEMELLFFNFGKNYYIKIWILSFEILFLFGQKILGYTYQF